MATKPVTTADVFTGNFGYGKICRFSPNASGVYSRIWVAEAPSYPIGMVDDGVFLYSATWSTSTIYRYSMLTGVRDTTWEIHAVNASGGNAGDMESLTTRVVGGRTRICAGFADPSGGPHLYEYDIKTKVLVKRYTFRNHSRGCDWIWALPNNEFLVGTESSQYWRINIDTGAETPYINGVGTSYSIEMRNGIIAAANASSGSSLTIGRCNPHDASGYVETRVFTGLPVGIYFSTSIEFDGKHAWISNFNGGGSSSGTPIYRINTSTGAGSTQPVAYIPEGWDVPGIYVPFRDARFNNLTGSPLGGDVHMDPTEDASFRMLS